jgi:hypothetical protein
MALALAPPARQFIDEPCCDTALFGVRGRKVPSFVGSDDGGRGASSLNGSSLGSIDRGCVASGSGTLNGRLDSSGSAVSEGAGVAGSAASGNIGSLGVSEGDGSGAVALGSLDPPSSCRRISSGVAGCGASGSRAGAPNVGLSPGSPGSSPSCGGISLGSDSPPGS